MAIIDSPPSGRWYQARIVGLADISGVTGLEPATTAAVQHAARQAVAQLLPSALDVYLTARIGGEFSSVRITNIPLGVLGLSVPGPDHVATLSLWVAETGDQPHAHSDEHRPVPLMLSSAIAVHAARRALGDGAHQLDLGEHGHIEWTPYTALIEPHAGVPAPAAQPRAFQWHDLVIGNYLAPTDPGYAVWLRFTDPATGEAEEEAHLLTPAPAGPHLDNPDPAELTPPHPPRLFVPTLADLRGERPE